MKSLKVASILFFGATLLLKVSSMIRDMIIAYYFGDTYVTDAYLAAFIIPNMIILFMTTGMKNTFVPSYIEALTEQREKQHLTHILKGTAIIGLILSVIGIVISPYIIPILYPNFHLEATDIAVWVSIIYFVAIFIVCINAVLEGLLDARKEFSFSVMSQVIVVVFTIIGAVTLSPVIGVYSLPIGFLLGAIVSLAVKYVYVLRRKLVAFKTKMDWLDVKAFYIIFIPVGITVAVGQINLLVDTIFANGFDEGVIAYLNYANRLVHFPQALIGVTIGTLVFPLLSKAAMNQDDGLFRKGIEQGLTLMFFVLMPAVVGMMFLMSELIELIYERGAFSHEATVATTQVAILYLGSVLFYSLHGVITKGFYSKKKGHIILFVGGISIGLNILFNYLFSNWIGYQGLALSSSFVGAIYVTICFIILIKLAKGLNLKFIGKEFLKVIMATSIMSLVLVYTIPKVQTLVQQPLLIIVITGITGAVIYALSSVLLKTTAIGFILKRNR
ncbi:murein biosynthesis integral membrane protein MurJ [Halalkalibacter okhensis]|uniref:Lipid II flippase n=1 Tax=Halalkalibacter okhensis TaxID=333138 RepID=A0A0B0IFD1_9BACI|nr:murein biosynthesis integral membrane protein MurJ [Halalkalibacter okhensis]KHF39597.1 membrane protein [Halalkalibacter okhensis]